MVFPKPTGELADELIGDWWPQGNEDQLRADGQALIADGERRKEDAKELHSGASGFQEVFGGARLDAAQRKTEEHARQLDAIGEARIQRGKDRQAIADLHTDAKDRIDRIVRTAEIQIIAAKAALRGQPAAQEAAASNIKQAGKAAVQGVNAELVAGIAKYKESPVAPKEGQRILTIIGPTGCPPPGPITITGPDGGQFTLDATQRKNAMSVFHAARQINAERPSHPPLISDKAMTVALMVGLCESHFFNLCNPQMDQNQGTNSWQYADDDPNSAQYGWYWDEKSRSGHSDNTSVGILQQTYGEHLWGTDLENMMNPEIAIRRFFLGYEHPDGSGHNAGLVEAATLGRQQQQLPDTDYVDYNDPKWDLHTLGQLVQNSEPGNHTPGDPGAANYGPWEKGAKELYDKLKDCP
jgi:hypothetical protein